MSSLQPLEPATFWKMFLLPTNSLLPLIVLPLICQHWPNPHFSLQFPNAVACVRDGHYFWVMSILKTVIVTAYKNGALLGEVPRYHTKNMQSFWQFRCRHTDWYYHNRLTDKWLLNIGWQIIFFFFCFQYQTKTLNLKKNAQNCGLSVVPLIQHCTNPASLTEELL